MNITKVLKSFDIFNTETVRFFKEKAINIFLIETKKNDLNGISIDNSQKAININVINRPKTYNLLISAQKRLEAKRAKEKQDIKL